MARLGIEPRTSDNSSQELYHGATQADIHGPHSPNCACIAIDHSNLVNQKLV